jgi:SAM-dependent methyltransferase
MHNTSFDKMEQFVKTIPMLLKSSDIINVLDIGSQIVSEQQQSYKELFKDPKFKYEGCDIEKGLNVDIVMTNPYSIPVKDRSYDVIISGQTYEHIEFFWITSLELARIIKPGGLLCIIAPGGGQIHRFPVDCWRYHPDGMDAIIKWIGFDKIETSINLDAHWKDCVLIAKKPLNFWQPKYTVISHDK